VIYSRVEGRKGKSQICHFLIFSHEYIFLKIKLIGRCLYSISFCLSPQPSSKSASFRNRFQFHFSINCENCWYFFSYFFCISLIPITSDFFKCSINTGTYKIGCSLSALKWKMDIFLRQSSDCSPLYVELSFTPNSRQPVRCETCLFYTQFLYRCCSLSLYRSDKEK
jgi:hypothetical protein